MQPHIFRSAAIVLRATVSSAVLAVAACGPATLPPSPPEPVGADTDATTATEGWTVPRFERQKVGDTGIEAYLLKGFSSFDHNTSDDGSLVATGNLTHGGFEHGVIGVRFAAPIGESDIDGIVTGYLDFLQEVFEVSDTAGYGLGHTLENQPAAKGVIDFWQMEDGQEMAVKAWGTTTHMIVFYVAGHGEYPSHNVREMFFNGARFPAP